MSKTAFVFPGQGAQYVGMAKAMTDRFPELNEKLETANEVLGFDIRKLMFEGPEKDLSLTANTQPAILIASVLCMIPFLNAGAKPDLCAGLSLGEYTAHVLSGTFDFEDAVALHEKSRFRQDEVPKAREAWCCWFDGRRACAEEARSSTNYSNYNCPTNYCRK